MTSTGHRWQLEVVRADGSCAGRAPIEPEWGAAYEAARFSGIRAGRLPDRRDSSPGVIEPIWDAAGAPYVAAVRAVVSGEAGTCGESEIPLEYFRRFVRDALARLVEDAGVTVGEGWRYRILAAPAEERHSPPSTSVDFAIEDVAPPLELGASALGPLLAASAAYGPSAPDDVPVLIPRHVLEETIVHAHRAGELETGGFLVGRMHRDPARGELFVQITAELPAEHTECERTRMVFTPETWIAALDAVARRGAGEELCGWFHHHPYFCLDCPPERRQTCPLRPAFFSQEDVTLTRTCFARGHQIALLLSTQEDDAIHVALFGWRRGLLVERGFRVLHEDDDEKGD